MKTLQWVGSVLLVLVGAGNVVQGINYGPSILTLVCGLAVLPPVWRKAPAPGWLAVPVWFAGFAAFGLSQPRQQPAAELTPRQIAERDSIEAVNEVAKKFSDDMEYSYIKASRAIKKQLKDPDSFEEISHRAGYGAGKGIYVSCEVTYRAKNSFGGYAVETARVDFNQKMEPINIVTQ